MIHLDRDGLCVVEDAEDPFLEVGIFGGGEGEGGLVAAGEVDEGFDVVGAIVTGIDDQIIAGFLAFLIEPTAQEPDGGMEEEEGFEEALENDDEVIEAAKVGEFVRENGDRLFTWKSAHERDGKDDHGADNSGHDRTGDFLGPDHGGHATMTHGAEREREGLGPRGFGDGLSVAANLIDHLISPKNSNEHEDKTEQVEADDPD